MCGAKTCGRRPGLSSELLHAAICPIAISQYSSRLLAIERKGLTNREVGAQSHGPPGKPVGSRAAETFVKGPRSGQAQASPQGCRGRLSPPLRRAGAPTRASAPLPRVEPVPGLTRANAPWTMHQTEHSTRAILQEPTSLRLGSRRASNSGRRATFAASTRSSRAAAQAGADDGARSRGRGDGRAGRGVEGTARGRLWGQATGVVDGGDAPRTRLWGRPGTRARSAVARVARRLAATGTDAEICSRSGG